MLPPPMKAMELVGPGMGDGEWGMEEAVVIVSPAVFLSDELLHQNWRGCEGVGFLLLIPGL
jgi:hypothetical protein